MLVALKYNHRNKNFSRSHINTKVSGLYSQKTFTLLANSSFISHHTRHMMSGSGAGPKVPRSVSPGKQPSTAVDAPKLDFSGITPQQAFSNADAPTQQPSFYEEKKSDIDNNAPEVKPLLPSFMTKDPVPLSPVIIPQATTVSTNAETQPSNDTISNNNNTPSALTGNHTISSSIASASTPPEEPAITSKPESLSPTDASNSSAPTAIKLLSVPRMGAGAGVLGVIKKHLEDDFREKLKDKAAIPPTVPVEVHMANNPPQDPLIIPDQNEDDAFPFGSPLPPIQPNLPVQESPTFTDEQFKPLADDLKSRGLLIHEKEEEKLTSSFHELLSNNNNAKVPVCLDLAQDFIFEAGILQASTSESIFLSGEQKHVVVIYAAQAGTKIVFGYLTSTSSNSTIVLSKDQPFNFVEEDKEEKNTKHKKQRFAILKEPLLIQQDQIMPLQPITLKSGLVVDQAKEAALYVNRVDIASKLQETLAIRVIPQINNANNLITVYDGNGITKVDVDEVILKYDQIAETTMDELMEEYIKRKKPAKSYQDAKMA